jgi:hypothetical protein
LVQQRAELHSRQVCTASIPHVRLNNGRIVDQARFSRGV